MFVERKAERKLKAFISNDRDRRVLLVEGARQVGKTTLIRKVLKDLKKRFHEINLENNKSLCSRIDHCLDFESFEQLISLEYSLKKGDVIFFDEAQESQRLGSFVRFMKETWSDYSVILSGSSMARLFKEDTRFPVGRVTSLLMLPFSFEEFLVATRFSYPMDDLVKLAKKRKISSILHDRLIQELENYFDVGGLPEVVLSFHNQEDWRGIRDDLYYGYLNDFKRVFGDQKHLYFEACLLAVACLQGFPFKNSYVGHFLENARSREIIATLSRLETWKMIFRVEQRGPSPQSQFHPKRFLFDLGLSRKLRELALPKVRLKRGQSDALRTSLGGLVENMVMSVLIHEGGSLSGWKKSSSGSEVDFVCKMDDEIVPMECKSAVALKNSHLGGVFDFMEHYKSPFGMVVSLAPYEVRKLRDKMRVINIPLYLVERWSSFV